MKSDYKYGIVDTGESNKNEHVYFIRCMRRGMLWPPYRRPPKSHNLLNTTNIIVLVTRYEQCFGHCTATQCCRKLFFLHTFAGGGSVLFGEICDSSHLKKNLCSHYHFYNYIYIGCNFLFFSEKRGES